MSGPGDEEDWNARRKALSDRLEGRRKEREPKPEGGRRTDMSGMAKGIRLASELVAGVAVGGAIGYFLDQVAGTAPFGLIVLLLFGFAAGVLNVIRTVSNPR